MVDKLQRTKVEIVDLSERYSFLLLFISDPFFSETALTIFMKLCMMLDIDKRKKVTKPDYPKNFWIIQKVQKCGQNDSFLTFSQKWL